MVNFGNLLIASGTTGGDSIEPPDNRIIVAFMQIGGIGLKPQIYNAVAAWYDVYTGDGDIVQVNVAGRWILTLLVSNATSSRLRLYKAGGFTYYYAYYTPAS